MSLHDAYARRTPYERFLPDDDFPGRRFPAIAEEAARRGVGLDDPGAFAVLEAASEALDELRAEGDDPDTLQRHAAMLFHAFHHHAAGTPVFLLATGVVRMLADTEPWTRDAPDGPPLPVSTYLQFPQHLVWARADGRETPASLDGVFRTVTSDGRIHVMAVGGLLGDRPGFTVLPVPGAPAAHEADWCTTGMRGDGTDFASDMPGADLERLYEIRTVGEALKLVARAARVIRRFPEGVGPTATATASSTPVPSALEARRVTLPESS